jgi:hypothetical protein
VGARECRPGTDLFNIAHVEHFSSRNILVARAAAREGSSERGVPQYNVGAPPITSGPPVHVGSQAPAAVLRHRGGEWGPLTRALRVARRGASLPMAVLMAPRACADHPVARHRQHARHPAEMAGEFTEWVRLFWSSARPTGAAE